LVKRDFGWGIIYRSKKLGYLRLVEGTEGALGEIFIKGE
jgi:hypothetical protein